MCHIDEERDMSFLNYNALQCLRFHMEFSKRFGGDAGIPASTVKDYGEAPWKFALNSFQTYYLMASGAQWIRDDEWHFALIETNGLELESAVLELIYHLCSPWLIIAEFYKQLRICLSVPVLASVVKCGLPLDMKCFKYSAEAKSSESETSGDRSRHENRRNPEHNNSATYGNCSNIFRGLLNTIQDYFRKFWR
jgi:hypothetical protein